MNPAPQILRRLYGPERGPFEPSHTWQLHARLVHGIVVLPNGERFVSSSEDGTVHVVSMVDGRVVQTLEGHSGPVNSLCLTPDGARLITGGDDHTVRVWDVHTWKMQHVLEGHGAYVREVASSDTVIVSGSEDHTVRFWDLESGEVLHVGAAHRENLRTVAMSPDGTLAASSGLDNQLILWDVARGEVVRTLHDGRATVVRPTGFASLYMTFGDSSGRGHRDGPRHLQFVDGGRTLVSTAHEVIFWDIATGEETRRWPRWGWAHEAIALHPDGELLALAGHGYVQVRNLADGALVTTLGRGGKHVTALAFTPDRRWLLVGTNDGAVQLWDFAAGLQADDGSVHQHSICRMKVFGSRALTGDSGGGVMLWDLDAPAPLCALDVEFDANGRALGLGEQVALTAESRGFAVWDARTGALRRRCAGSLETPLALLPLADGRALVGNLGEGLSLWDLDEGGEASPLTGHTQQISILAVAPDGRHAVSNGYFERPEDVAQAKRKNRGNYVYVPSVSQLQGWDLETRSLLWTVAAGRDGDDYIDFVFCVFTPDGRLVTRSGEHERKLAFWNARAGVVVHTVDLPGNFPTATRVVGRDLVTVVVDYTEGDDTHPCTAVWIDLVTGQVSQQRSLGLFTGGSAAIGPDGSRIAITSKGTLAVYDGATGEPVGRYECGPNVRELKFTDDGRRLVIGDQAGRVHVLALAGWEPAPQQPWTPDELAALQAETRARTPARSEAAGKTKISREGKKASAVKKGGVKKAAAKKSAAKKAAAKKSTGKESTSKSAAKKAAAKKSAAKKSTAKKSTSKSTTKRSAMKKAATKKSSTKKSAAKKSTAKKSTGKKSASKKSTTNKPGPKKSSSTKPAAQKPTDRKSTAKKSATKKSTAKKSMDRKSTAKKSATKKSTAKKSTRNV